MVRCNYKDCKNIRYFRGTKIICASILEARSSHVSIRKDILQSTVSNNIKASNNAINIRDDTSRSVYVNGTINLVINIEEVQTVLFSVG